MKEKDSEKAVQHEEKAKTKRIREFGYRRRQCVGPEEGRLMI